MIRELIVPDANTVLISLPDEYIGKTVEVIAFAVDESNIKANRRTPVFGALKIDTSNFHFNRDEANER
jgi:hypothetical protein